ncbi:MAG: glycoside hydrolase domain-containing protein [Bacteroidota bacterium]
MNFVQAWIFTFSNTLELVFIVLGYINILNALIIFAGYNKLNRITNPFNQNNILEFWKSLFSPVFSIEKKYLILIPFVFLPIFFNFSTNSFFFSFVNILAILTVLMFDKRKINKYLSRLITIMFIILSLLILRVENIGNLKGIIKGLISIESLFNYYNEFFILWSIGANYLTVIIIIISFAGFFYESKFRFKPNIKYFIISITFLVLSLLWIDSSVLKFNVFSAKETMKIINDKNARIKPMERIAFFDSIGSNLNSLKSEFKFNNPFGKLKYFYSEQLTTFHLKEIKNSYKSNFPTNNDSFIVYPFHSIYKPNPDGSDLPLADSNFTMEVAKGEYENFQLLTYSDVDLHDITIKLGNSQFPASNIKCYQAGWINCRPPVYTTPRSGEYIDPLMTMEFDSNSGLFKEKNYSIAISKNKVNSFWISIFIPENIKRGQYILPIEISAKDSKNKIFRQNCKIRINVYNVIYPKNNKLKTGFSFNYELYQWYYGIYNLPFNERKKIYDFFLSLRATPTELNRYGKLFPPFEDWNYLIDRGSKAFCIGYYRPITNSDSISYPKFEKEFKKDIKTLNSNNFKKYAYLFAFDEMNYNQIYQNKEFYNSLFKTMHTKIRKIDKTIPIAITTEYDESLSDYIDWWMPINIYYTPEKAKKCIKPNQEQWWSVTMSTTPPYPTFFVDANAIEPRILFWQGSKYNIDGFKYYETILWQSNVCWSKSEPIGSPAEISDNKQTIEALKLGKRWPNVPWNSFTWTKYNGDGQLIYPGKNNELLPSIRFINIRDGIEDFELLNLLKEKIKKSPNSFLENTLYNMYNLTPNHIDYINNPSKLLENKKKLLITLETI